MEKVIFITKLSQLKYVNDRYSRLYYGNEFCERLIPRLSQLKRVRSYAKEKKLNFSLVTPYVTNEGLKGLEVLFEFLKSDKINNEVIVNDFGVLNLINRNYPSLTPVLGRLLTKQKRGPRLIKLLERKTEARFLKYPRAKMRYYIIQRKLPLESDHYYKGSNVSSVPIIHNFLIKRRIKRIELDNVAQGLLLELPPDKISASLYLPYLYISTTYFCLTAGCEQAKTNMLKIKPCRKECQRYTFRLRHKTMPKIIYLKGNTQFYKNSNLPLVRELEGLGIDRIVYEPEIPI